MLCSAFGFTASHAGDVLGEEQWRWLESELRGSQSQVHLVVSSVQLLTTMPYVESWGHFPHAKQRLFRLLEATKTKGVVFLSGDVHFSELSGDPALGVVELTSSGMTHSCDTVWYAFACRWLLHRHHAHRVQPNATTTDINFGTVEIEWPNHNDGGATDGSRTAFIRLAARGVDGKPLIEHAAYANSGEGLGGLLEMPVFFVAADLAASWRYALVAAAATIVAVWACPPSY